MVIPREWRWLVLVGRLLGWTMMPAPGTMAPAMAEDEHPKELWTVQRLADWLGISRQAVHERMSHGTIRAHYIVITAGGRRMYLFDPARVKRWRDIHA